VQVRYWLTGALENRCSGNQPWAGGSNPSPSARVGAGVWPVAGFCFRLDIQHAEQPAQTPAAANAQGQSGTQWHSGVATRLTHDARSTRGLPIPARGRYLT
jgi:hypothetical protein